MLEVRTRSSGRPSWIVFFAGCIVSFLVGRNTAVPLFQFQPSSSNIEEIAEASADCPLCEPLVNITCPLCEPCQSLDEIKKSEPNKDEIVFDKSIATDPTKAVAFMNEVCKSIVESSTTPQGRMIGIPIIIFCHKHTLTYRRGLGYEWDNAASSEQGYYTGKHYESMRTHDLPPFQMDVFQYTAIHAVIASIPGKPIKHELEKAGNLKDVQSNYDSWTPNDGAPRGNDGPRVLFWGCGSDTPMHSLLMEFLGGNITFIDNNAKFIGMCKKSHPDIRLIEPVGSTNYHTSLIEKLVPSDGSGLETDEVNDPLTESQWMPKLSGIELEQPWDVIVIDGPAQNLGRSQPLYMAKRLAQSYSPNHYTHIFLHDASRHANCVIANAIMGHDPSVYMGNTLPRKGLKHWRVPGRNRKLPATDNDQS